MQTFRGIDKVLHFDYNKHLVSSMLSCYQKYNLALEIEQGQIAISEEKL